MAQLALLNRVSLGAGLALIALSVMARVRLWARPPATSAQELAPTVLSACAPVGAGAMVLHLIAIVEMRVGTLGGEAASATLAAISLFLQRLPFGGREKIPAAAPESASPFPNYTQITSRIPVGVWQTLRFGSLLGGLTVVGLLLAVPATGLFVLWRVVIPCLPVLFMVAPGLWRNLCPLAAANQLPRWFGVTRALTAPAWLKEYGYVIAFSLFVLFVALRRLGLDHSGILSALLLFGAMASALAGGVLLKGKSGWCSSICPLLPVQRIYGQTPLVMVANAHCQPCVGCAKNCYDFNPRAAYLADLNDSDAYWGGYRRLFVGAFPGLVLSFFTVPRAHALAGLLTMGLFMAISVFVFTLLSTFWKTSQHTVTTLFGAAAFVLFYWFVAAFGPTELTWLIRLAAVTLAATWLVRTVRKEGPYLERATGGPAAAAVSGTVGAGAPLTGGSVPRVTFADGTEVTPQPGASLLELAEAHQLPIEAGCRMGVCGADPVTILDGMECTSPVGEDERATLERLGLGPNTRLACCVRVNGPVKVSLTPDAAGPVTVRDFRFDPAVERVVIVGNGIAGVTAADQLRRRHPDVAIDLVGAEPHHLYNRMGIARLVYGRSAMEGLYLNPDAWYADRAVTTWLNTRVQGIDLSAAEVRLGTGETLPFDRLILATGSSAALPPIDGFGLSGTGVLRTARDAIALRAFAQLAHTGTAVIAGGGLLGLEAAYALNKLGLRAVVLERSGQLLRRQLDARGAELLTERLSRMGIETVNRAEVAAVSGRGRLEQVTLRDGRSLTAEILLVAAGITPNVALARRAGLAVRRGIVVDERMCTSDPRIYAIGDAAEFAGSIAGLWAAAAAQAEVAAENVAGGERVYAPVVPATTLKVAGIDLTSLGRLVPDEPGDETVVHDDGGGRYGKLIIDSAGRIVGAILLGFPPEIVGAARSVLTGGSDVVPQLERLRQGRWEVLSERGA